MTLAELRAADPLLADAIVEGVGGRVAFAEMIVGRISDVAADRAVFDERVRVNSHLRLGKIAGMNIAIEAIEAGLTVADVDDGYARAAAAVGDARSSGPKLVSHELAAISQKEG